MGLPIRGIHEGSELFPACPAVCTELAEVQLGRSVVEVRTSPISAPRFQFARTCSLAQVDRVEVERRVHSITSPNNRALRACALFTNPIHPTAEHLKLLLLFDNQSLPIRSSHITHVIPIRLEVSSEPSVFHGEIPPEAE